MTYHDRLARNINLSYISHFFGHLVFTIPIWVAFETRFLTFSQISIIVGCASAITIITELPSGALADMIGRKKTMILGWILMGVGYCYVAFADSFFTFLAGFIVEAIGSAFISGADTALVFDSLKELNREKEFIQYTSRVGFILRIALIIGAAMGGYLYDQWASLPYIMTGVFCFVAAYTILYMQEPRIDSEKFSLSAYIAQTRIGFQELFKSSYMKKLTVYYTLTGGITWSCLVYFNVPFSTEAGFTEIEQSWLYATVYLVGALILLFLVEHKKFLTRKRAYLGFPFVMALSLLPGAFANKMLIPFMLIGTVIAGSGRFAILDTYTNKEFTSKYRATALSALNMLVSLFFIIIVGISGKIQDIYGTGVIFTALGVVTVFLVIPSAIGLVREHDRYVGKTG